MQTIKRGSKELCEYCEQPLVIFYEISETSRGEKKVPCCEECGRTVRQRKSRFLSLLEKASDEEVAELVYDNRIYFIELYFTLPPIDSTAICERMKKLPAHLRQE